MPLPLPLFAFAFHCFAYCLCLCEALPLPRGKSKAERQWVPFLPAIAFGGFASKQRPKRKGLTQWIPLLIAFAFGSDANAKAISNGIYCLRPLPWGLCLEAKAMNQWGPIGYCFCFEAMDAKAMRAHWALLLLRGKDPNAMLSVHCLWVKGGTSASRMPEGGKRKSRGAKERPD